MPAKCEYLHREGHLKSQEEENEQNEDQKKKLSSAKSTRKHI